MRAAQNARSKKPEARDASRGPGARVRTPSWGACARLRARVPRRRKRATLCEAPGRACAERLGTREPSRSTGARASSLPLPSRKATQWRRPFPRRGPSPTYSLTWTASFWVRSLRPPPAKTVQGKPRKQRRLPGPGASAGPCRGPRGGRRAWRRRGPGASRDSGASRDFHFWWPRVGTEYAGAGA